MVCIFLGFGLFLNVPARAAALGTQLTIPTIAVDDQNGNPKKVFTLGDVVEFVLSVNNPASQSDNATINATVLTGNSVTLLSSSPQSVTIPPNSTPEYSWHVTIPQSAPSGIYYYHAIVQDSQGTVEGWATFQEIVAPTPTPTQVPSQQPTQPPVQPTSPPTRTDYVTACTGTNYTSSCDRFTVGQYINLQKTYVSFWIPCDLTLFVNTGSNFDNNPGVFNNNTPDLSQVWPGNTVHSLKVEPRTDCSPTGPIDPPTQSSQQITRTDYVTACTGPNYSGSCDRYHLGQYLGLQKTYASFWIPCDLTLFVNTGQNLDGNPGVFNNNIPDLSQVWPGNTVHSLKVEPRTDCTPTGSIDPPVIITSSGNRPVDNQINQIESDTAPAQAVLSATSYNSLVELTLSDTPNGLNGDATLVVGTKPHNSLWGKALAIIISKLNPETIQSVADFYSTVFDMVSCGHDLVAAKSVAGNPQLLQAAIDIMSSDCGASPSIEGESGAALDILPLLEYLGTVTLGLLQDVAGLL